LLGDDDAANLILSAGGTRRALSDVPGALLPPNVVQDEPGGKWEKNEGNRSMYDYCYKLGASGAKSEGLKFRKAAVIVAAARHRKGRRPSSLRRGETALS
jgi:hypothetical protein